MPKNKSNFSELIASIISIHPELEGEIIDIADRVGTKRKVIDAFCSSKSSEWETPQPIFDKLDAEFHFTLDPCSTEKNHKCPKYFTKKDNGLVKEWGNHTVFVNPPYGREIPKWVKKSYEEALRGALVVMLIPSRTDTLWWHKYIMKGEIRFIKGRIGFINRTLPSYVEGGKFKVSKALFPSAIVIFGRGKRQVSSYQFKSVHDIQYVQKKLV